MLFLNSFILALKAVVVKLVVILGISFFTTFILASTGVLVCMFLSCHVRVSEWIPTL